MLHSIHRREMQVRVPCNLDGMTDSRVPVRTRRLLSLFLSVGLASFITVQVWAAPNDYERALRYVQEQNFDSALGILKKVLARSPTNVKAQNLMGIALTATDKLEEGNVHFRKAIRINSKFYPALKNLGINELRLNRVEQAEAHLRRAALLSPRDPAIHMALAEINFRRKNFADAVGHYLESQGLFLSSPDTILNFARSCFESGQPEEAGGALELISAGASSQAHFQAGVMLAQLGRYESAARQFEFAQSGYPDPYEVGFNLTLAYLKTQDYKAAIRTAEGLISRGFQKAELYNLLAQAYEKSGGTVEAYNALRKATQIDPRDEDNYLDLIALGIDHANFDLALDIANIGLRNIPNSYRLLLQHGAVLAFKGQLKPAIGDFEAASRLDPQKNLPFFAIVMARMQLDQMYDSIEAVRERIAQHPGDYLLLYALGEVLSRKGAALSSEEGAEAIRALEESVRLDPNFADSRIALGRLYLRRADLGAAIQQFERALELHPEDLSPCYPLAQAYRKKGDSKRSEELLARFEQFKEGERQKFVNRNLLRLLREGDR